MKYGRSCWIQREDFTTPKTARLLKLQVHLERTLFTLYLFLVTKIVASLIKLPIYKDFIKG